MGYNNWNADYGLMTAEGPRQALIFPRLKKVLEDHPNAAVLDLGCGNGATIYNMLDTNFAAATGIDINPDLLEFGRAHVTDARVGFVQADLMASLPLASAAFDVVLCVHVLNDLPDVAPMLAEAARVMKPGGELCAVCIHPMVPVFWQIAEQSAEPAQPKIAGFESYNERGQRRDYRLSGSAAGLDYYHKNLQELSEGCQQAGLVMTHIEELGHEQTEKILQRPVDVPKFLYFKAAHK